MSKRTAVNKRAILDTVTYNLLESLDKRPKNTMTMKVDYTKTPDLLYDCDTIQGIMNCYCEDDYNPILDNWCKEHLSTIRSKVGMSPRGEWFMYARLYDGYIYSIGDEQGNYTGGDFVWFEKHGAEGIKRYIEKIAACKEGSYEKSLYENIKDIPVISDEKYCEMIEAEAQLRYSSNRYDNNGNQIK